VIVLVLVVCLIGQPGACREERPPAPAMSPMACMVLGQQIAATWLEDHPKLRLDRWRCENVKGDGA
jgi:hypothetical protein